MRVCYIGNAVLIIPGSSWTETSILQGAQALIGSDRLRLQPCHRLSAVGQMMGVVTPSMPLLVVENRAHGNRAYYTLNAGLGKALRFGAKRVVQAPLECFVQALDAFATAYL